MRCGYWAAQTSRPLKAMHQVRTFISMRASLYGAVVGGLLLSVVWCLDHSTSGLPLLPVFHGLWSGAFLGAVVGLSIWAAFTPRDLHPLIRAVVVTILSLAVCTFFYLLYLLLLIPGADSASGQMAQGLDSFYHYVVFVIPGSLVLGVFAGVPYGILRRLHTRRHDS